MKGNIPFLALFLYCYLNLIGGSSWAQQNDLLTAKEFKNQGNKELRAGNLNNAVAFYKKGIHVANKNEDWKLAAIMHNNLGICYNKLGMYETGMGHYDSSLTTYLILKNDTLIAQSYLNIGILYKEWNALEASMQYLLKGMQLFEKFEMDKELGATYNALGNLHLDLHELDKGEEYLQKGLKIRERLGNQRDLAGSYNSLARYYETQKKFERATFYLKKAIQAKKQLKSRLYLASSYTRLGEVFLQMNNVDSARFYIQQSMEIRKEKNHAPGMAANLNDFGEIHLFEGNSKLALGKFMEAYALAKIAGNLQITEEIVANLFIVYKKENVLDTAIQMANILIEVRDSLNAQDRAKRTIELEVKYGVEKKDKDLEIKESRILYLKSRNTLYLIIGFAICLVLVAMIYYSKKLASSKKVIEIQHDHILLQHSEFQHRIKNNLELLSGILTFKQQQSDFQEVRDALEEVKKKILVMTLVNNELNISVNNGKPISILVNQYLRDLFTNIMVLNQYTENQIDLVFKQEDVYVSFEQAIYLGLVMNEVFTNSFKYAILKTENPIVKLGVVQKNGIPYITFEDNGPGFKNGDLENKGLGMSLIEEFSKQIGAEISYKNKEQGIQFILSLKTNG